MKTVFVSSTFKDMQYERDAIREITAPVLNDEARKHGDEFDFCDLRWGIDTSRTDTTKSKEEIEEKNNLKVLNVCLDEIDRCKPPMIVILGYRYGWMPENEDLIKKAADRKKLQIEDLQKSVTALEIEYGSLSDKTKFQNTLFYFREIDGEFPAEFDGEDDEHTSKMNALKQRIRDFDTKTGKHIKEYHLEWNGNSFDGVKEFAHMLAEDIKEMLMPQWAEYEKLTPFQKERMAHHTFIGEKSEMFRARKKEADELIKQIKTEPVTIIKGAVGSGKSTLFSYIAKNMESTEWTVLPFVLGLTSQSNSTFEIMANAVYFLEDKLGIKEHYIDEIDRMTQQRKIHSIEEWREKLAELCWRYTETGPKLLIMVDAADQLTQSEERDKLYFIPTNVNENIHFAMTCTTDFETNDWNFYILKELSADDKRNVISGTLSRIGRELSKNVVNAMVDEEASSNPLYLSLLIQRLTMMNIEDFEKISKDKDQMAAIEKQHIEIIKNCPKNLEEMSAELLLEAGRRIENPELVSRVGQYLAISREGLRKKDLAALLGEIWTEVDFSHFINYMCDSFMLRDDGRYDFTHKSIRAGFLKKCDIEKTNNEILSHFKSLPTDDPVRISEIIYHTIKADDKRFFIDYIGKNYYVQTIHYINQAAVDTYHQCITDNGKWICDILGNLDLFDDNYPNNFACFTNFISFILKEKFTEKIDELYIQLDILTANKKFAEYAYSQYKTNQSKKNLSVSYNRLADIYEKLGSRENFQTALELYSKCMELSEQLSEYRKTIESEIDLAISYSKVAGIYKKLDGSQNLYKSLELSQKTVNVIEQIYAIETTNEIKSYLPLGYDGLADVYINIGGKENLKKALELYQKSLNIEKEIYSDKQTTSNKIAIAKSCHNIAFVYEHLGNKENLENALKLYGECLDTIKQIYTANKNPQIKKILSLSYEMEARAYSDLGSKKDLQTALQLYQKSIDMRKQIYNSEKTDSSKRSLSNVYKDISIVYETLGGSENLKKALEMCKEHMKMAEEIYLSEKTSRSKRELAVSYNETALIYEKFKDRENVAKAVELHKKSLNIKEELAESEKTIRAYEDLAVGLYNFSGYIHPFYRKPLLERALKIALKVYNDEPNYKRKQLIERIYRDINIIDAMIPRPHGKIVSGTASIEKIVINRETKQISFTAICSVSAECKMVRGGLVATNDKNIGENVRAEKGYYNYLKIAKNVTEKTKKLKYTWTQSDVKENDIWYVRAYLVCKDTDENEVSIYSNVVKAGLNDVIQ